jgi:GGDEF domain-containing protein
MIEIIEGIKKLERNTDIVAQYDQPDSFAIILPETNIEGAKKFASRVRTAVSKISTVANSKAGNIKLIAGVTASEGLCNDIGKILGAGDEALKIAEERGPWLGTFNQLKPDSITKAKHIDTRLVQELTEQLIAKPYGIFSFPMLVAFLEHQYYRAKRSRQVSYVLLVSLVSEEAASEDVNVLRKAISLLVERLISLQNKSFLLFQYNGNTVAAMCSKGMLSLLKGYSQQIAESLCESPLADDESIKAYSLEHKLCKVGIDDDGVRRMLSITPVELS